MLSGLGCNGTRTPSLWDTVEPPLRLLPEGGSEPRGVQSQRRTQASLSTIPTGMQPMEAEADIAPSAAPTLLPGFPARLVIPTPKGSADLTATNASRVVSTETVSGQCSATDIESVPPSLGLSAGLNGASFCGARDEKCLGSVPRLPRSVC